MRPLVLLIGAAVIGCSGASEPGLPTDARVADSSADAGSHTLRFATVNLRCLLDDWSLRVGMLADELVAVAPDVIAFQEVCRESGGADNVQQLVTRLRGITGQQLHLHRADTHRSWDQYDEGIAIASTYPLLDTDTFDLPPGTFPRRAVLARVEIGGRDVWVSSTHLSFGDTQAALRASQLGALRSELDRQRGAAPAVIGGDLNEGPDGAALVEATSAGWTDAWAHLQPTEPGLTFPSHAPTARIDYALLSAGGALTPTRASIILDREEGGVRPSDHLGVSFELRVP